MVAALSAPSVDCSIGENIERLNARLLEVVDRARRVRGNCVLGDGRDISKDGVNIASGVDNLSQKSEAQPTLTLAQGHYPLTHCTGRCSRGPEAWLYLPGGRAQVTKGVGHAALKVDAFVELVAVAATLLGVCGAEFEEDDHVGRRQAALGRPAPVGAQALNAKTSENPVVVSLTLTGHGVRKTYVGD